MQPSRRRNVVHWVHWAHGPNDVISVDFKESHFEFRVNQELTKGHMDFFGVIIGFFIQKNMGLETKILSLSLQNVISLSWRPF